ncbi:hypothetical protein N7462_011714 [Penicillium macrosclerotiorum]|uniref:uncharacterized protein n=1 Tax=Penicillium macrosclerotiorum TaxID=303699 RepID=UPI0025483B7A|nr:uncharacterized protein N7462_011714 [Penicillium macrosclerotiorum]KAJ5662788.1 hypothetical protein N7462_011714 [Penicillium macrosclerotiorum]
MPVIFSAETVKLKTLFQAWSILDLLYDEPSQLYFRQLLQDAWFETATGFSYDGEVQGMLMSRCHAKFLRNLLVERASAVPECVIDAVPDEDIRVDYMWQTCRLIQNTLREKFRRHWQSHTKEWNDREKDRVMQMMGYPPADELRRLGLQLPQPHLLEQPTPTQLKLYEERMRQRRVTIPRLCPELWEDDMHEQLQTVPQDHAKFLAPQHSSKPQLLPQMNQFHPQLPNQQQSQDRHLTKEEHRVSPNLCLQPSHRHSVGCVSEPKSQKFPSDRRKIPNASRTKRDIFQQPSVPRLAQHEELLFQSQAPQVIPSLSSECPMYQVQQPQQENIPQDEASGQYLPQENLLGQSYQQHSAQLVIPQHEQQWGAQVSPFIYSRPSVIPDCDIQVIRAENPTQPLVFRCSDFLPNPSNPMDRSPEGDWINAASITMAQFDNFRVNMMSEGYLNEGDRLWLNPRPLDTVILDEMMAPQIGETRITGFNIKSTFERAISTHYPHIRCHSTQPNEMLVRPSFTIIIRSANLTGDDLSASQPSLRVPSLDSTCYAHFLSHRANGATVSPLWSANYSEQSLCSPTFGLNQVWPTGPTQDVSPMQAEFADHDASLTQLVPTTWNPELVAPPTEHHQTTVSSNEPSKNLGVLTSAAFKTNLAINTPTFLPPVLEEPGSLDVLTRTAYELQFPPNGPQILAPTPEVIFDQANLRSFTSNLGVGVDWTLEDLDFETALNNLNEGLSETPAQLSNQLGEQRAQW